MSWLRGKIHYTGSVYRKILTHRSRVNVVQCAISITTARFNYREHIGVRGHSIGLEGRVCPKDQSLLIESKHMPEQSAGVRDTDRGGEERIIEEAALWRIATGMLL